MPQPNEKPKLTLEERNKLIDESMQRAYAKVAAEMPDVKPVSVSPSGAHWYTSLLTPKRAYAVTNPFTGNITYNPETMADQSQQDMEQTIAHELTHTKQTQDTPWTSMLGDVGKHILNNVSTMWGGNEDKVPAGVRQSSPYNDPYYWRPREMEAFQAERNRASKMGLSAPDPIDQSRDIMLPGPSIKRGIDTGPSAAMMQKNAGPNIPDPYASALAKQKAGIPLTPGENAAMRMQLEQMARFKSQR